MPESWLVLKFGGSSVSGNWQWRTIASMLRQRLAAGHRVLLVCSALKGVTDALQGLAVRANHSDAIEIARILKTHQQLGQVLGVDVQDLLAQAEDELRRALKLVASAADGGTRYAAIAGLLPLGEWLSTHIGERYLARSFEIDWVDACTALTTLPEANPGGRRAWLSARCASGVDQTLQQNWSMKKRVLITQGFVASHHAGGSALLGRGGSDTSACLFASRLAAQHVEIWTDVQGLFSADPGLIPTARLLKRLDYDEALEMASSGAKVVHSRCIRAAAEVGIPILVGNLANPKMQGTRICAQRNEAHSVRPSQDDEGIRGVCYRSDMVVMLLQNLDTREHVGFLAWVFECIAKTGVSIDLVATSETTTTVAFNRTSNVLDDDLLEALAGQLRQRCAVNLYAQCSAINLVGCGARLALADLDPGSGFFLDHRLLMLSQSANDLCISIVVDSTDAEVLLEKLHTSVIGKGMNRKQLAAVFGPSWRALQG